jgi:hypothetical protein
MKRKGKKVVNQTLYLTILTAMEEALTTLF